LFAGGKEVGNIYRVLVRKCLEKKLIRRQWRRWEMCRVWRRKGARGRYKERQYGDIKIVLQEIGFFGVNWINLAQVGEKSEPVVKRVMNLWMFHKIRRIS
jgi:hypothetical protein